MSNTFLPRSYLFVPGDSRRKMDKARAGAADAIVLDLEDSVADANKPEARAMVRDFLLAASDRTKQQVWVRINPLNTPWALDDVVAVIEGRPDGLLVPKCESRDDVVVLDHWLCALERKCGWEESSVKVIPVATETPGSLFKLDTYRGAAQRLAGLTWGAEDLSAAVGATTNQGEKGGLAFTYEMARSLCLLGAKSAGIHAIDTVWTKLNDAEGLAAQVRAARRDGFNAKFAIHPDQIAAIHEGFKPSEAEVAQARMIVEAFTAQEGVGTARVNGNMVDKPHYVQALAVLHNASLVS